MYKLVLCISLCLPMTAQADRWPAALLSGSPELLTFSLLQEKPEGYRPVASRLARDAGLIGDPGLRQTRLRFAPAVAWDDNINGGIPGADIRLGPFDFRVDEASRAKEGVVVGFDAGAGADWAFGNGSMATLDTDLAWRHSPQHGLGWAAGQAEACLSKVYQLWRRIEGCLSVRGAERALSSTVTHRASIEHRSQHALSFGDAELVVGLFAEDRFGIVQQGVSFGAVVATDHALVWGLRLNLGAGVGGRSAATVTATTWVARELWGEPTSLSVNYVHEEGSSLFGTPREDDVYSVRITRRVTEQLSIFAGASARSSTVDVFDDKTVTAGVTIAGWRR